jgi:3-oxoacyl-(acyl-carrier-protein) synthase
MYVEKYMWRAGTIELDRSKYMTNEYIKMIGWFASSVVGSNAAMLYAAGPAIHHSDSRNFSCNAEGAVVAKSQIGLNVMNVAKAFTNVEFNYISTNANTCASSMHCLYEAKHLLDEGYDKVIVVAMEMVEPSEILMFEQLGVDIKCGDGLAILVLSNKTGVAKIDDVVWRWNNDRSPMSVSKEGYMKVLNGLDLLGVNVVKPHGTGTDRNDQAENEAIKEVGLGSMKRHMYKKEVGHTQGASTAVELGMLLDDMVIGDKAVVLASGMGGYYGGCTVWKSV